MTRWGSLQSQLTLYQWGHLSTVWGALHLQGYHKLSPQCLQMLQDWKPINLLHKWLAHLPQGPRKTHSNDTERCIWLSKPEPFEFSFVSLFLYLHRLRRMFMTHGKQTRPDRQGTSPTPVQFYSHTYCYNFFTSLTRKFSVVTIEKP